ncbi:MAG TPA: hypothetical protein PKX56_10745, partial [Marmoricola sp.]|nr:hypothetical protein [Marmoricola sp.]
PYRPPWYALLRVPINSLFTQVLARLPGGGYLLDRRSERARRVIESFQFGGTRPPVAAIGDDAGTGRVSPRL